MTAAALVLAALAAGLSIAALLRRPAVVEVVQPAPATPPVPEPGRPVRLEGPREALRPGATNDRGDELLGAPPRIFTVDAEDLAEALRRLGLPGAYDVAHLGGTWDVQVKRSANRAGTAQKEQRP